MVKKYIPKQGDIVFFDFSPTKGHEQSGKRPGIIVSNNIFNNNTKMVYVCPISSNIKSFPTHYILEDSKKIKGSNGFRHTPYWGNDQGCNLCLAARINRHQSGFGSVFIKKTKKKKGL